ncbi:MAG: hypothetical protein EON92_03605 [Burkholderiales bacterium]|nr:MAG: hypothetical protein EON92_03605 [Burkholderiales bacterium]
MIGGNLPDRRNDARPGNDRRDGGNRNDVRREDPRSGNRGNAGRDDRRNDQQRLGREVQERRIREERQRADRFRQQTQRFDRNQWEQRYARQLRDSRRNQQYRYQQQYYDRLRQQQLRFSSRNYNYYNDPYYYTPASYRYSYGGRWYETNRYGSDLMRQAVNYGYREGLNAGRADREDGWRSDYRNSYAYEDANYGYNGYYIAQDQYNHYFRQGFQRGYQDGYNGRYQYGQRGSDGNYAIAAGILGVILGLQLLH